MNDKYFGLFPFLDVITVFYFIEVDICPMPNSFIPGQSLAVRDVFREIV